METKEFKKIYCENCPHETLCSESDKHCPSYENTRSGEYAVNQLTNKALEMLRTLRNSKVDVSWITIWTAQMMSTPIEIHVNDVDAIADTLRLEPMVETEEYETFTTIRKRLEYCGVVFSQLTFDNKEGAKNERI